MIPIIKNLQIDTLNYIIFLFKSMPDEFDENKILTSTLRVLGEVAKDDGYISYDELQLLKQVRFDVGLYEDTLKKALDDSIITKEESIELNNLKDQIISNASKVALWLDGKVSEDEEKMIKILTNLIERYFKS